MKKLVIFAVAITFTASAFASNMEGLRSNLELTSFDAQMMQSSEVEMPADPYAPRYQDDSRSSDLYHGVFQSIGKYESKEAAERSRDEIVKNLKDNSVIIWNTDISAVDNGSNYMITIKFASKDEFKILKGSVSPLHLSIKVEDLELSGMKVIFVEVNNSSSYSSNTTYQILYLAPKRGECSKLHYETFKSIGKYESEEKAKSTVDEIVKKLKDNSALIWRTDISAVDNGSNYLLTIEFGSKDKVHTLKGADSFARVFLKVRELESKGIKIIAFETTRSNFGSNCGYQILYLFPDSQEVSIDRIDLLPKN